MAITKPFVAKHGLAIANTTHIVFNSDGTIHANNAGIVDSSSSVTNTAFQSSLANTNLAIADRMQVANTVALVNDRIQVANLNATLASYWPSSNVITHVATEVAALVNSAPSTLDTLQELAAALGNNENFATTLTTNLGQKLGATASVTLTGDATGSGSFSSNAASINVTVSDTFASNANLQTEVTRINLLNTNLTGTNTALRTLIDDRIQVANVIPTINSHLQGGVGVDYYSNGMISIGQEVYTNSDVIFSSANVSTLSFGNDATLSWNVDDGTVDIAYDGVTLQVGQETHYYAKATEDISDGDVVMFAGAQGSHSLISKADMSSAGFKPEYVMGVATQDIDNNDFGYVTEVGKVRHFDTSVFGSGVVLYLSATTAGALTSIEPTVPNHSIEVAYTLDNKNNGTILVRVAHKVDLDELHGVYANSAVDGDVLIRSGNTWINSSNLTDAIVDIDDRMQVANTVTLVNDRMQVANATSLINDRIQVANLNATLAGYWPSANIINYVATNGGEVANAYLTSNYVTNTAFQSYVANTNARFTDHIANTSVANASFESTNNTITFTRQDSSVFDVVLTGITGSGGSANTEDISNQKFKTKQTGTEITYTVTVGTKTANSPWQSGSTSAYYIDGEEVPTLTLVPGFTYKFDQADATNASHPIAFYRDSAKTSSYPFGVGSTGTPGSTGAYTTIEVSANTPMTLYYQCQNHSYMGGQIAVLSDTSPKYAEQANVDTAFVDYWPSANVINYIATNAGGVTNTAFNAYIANTEPRISSLENGSVQLTTFTVNTLAAQGGGSLTYNDSNGQFNFRPSTGSLPTVSNSAPTLSGNGSLWFDEDDATLFIEYDGAWIDAAPAVGSSPNNFISFSGNNTLRLITASGDHIDADLAQLGGGGGVSGTTADLTGSSRVYTANGTATVFAASYVRQNPEDVFVTVDGLDQRPTTDFTLNGANVVFGTAPDAGSSVMVRTFNGLLGTNTASFDLNSYTANGTATEFFSPSNEALLEDLLVTVNGVVQRPTTDYTLSAQTVSFGTAPVNNSTVAVRSIRSRVAQVTEQTNITYEFANNTSIDADVVDQNIKIATYTANGSVTLFAANTDSITLEKSIVSVNGILQRPTTDYTMSGNNVAFGNAPANNDIVSIREFNTAGQVIKTNVLIWEEVSANATLSLGVGYFADCSSGPLQLTLPVTASMGDYVKIIDAVGKSSNNNITVNSNGSKIMGDAADMTVSTNRAAFTLVYYNATQGWLLSEV